MRIQKLIAEFDSKHLLPVDVNDVVSFVRREQIKDEVNFVAVELNTRVLRGSIMHTKLRDITDEAVSKAALAIYPGREAATIKRQLYGPLNAIMRTAAKARLCQMIVFEAPRVKAKPVPRAARRRRATAGAAGSEAEREG